MTRRALFVGNIFLAGFLQGSDFVLIPALSTTLTSVPYQFTSSAFALLFLPQTGGAIIGAAVAGWVQRRLGIGILLRLGLLSNLGAVVLLVSALHSGGRMAYELMLADSLLLGIGFGWTLSAVNHYSAHFFGKSAGASITLLNAMIGGATAVSPYMLFLLQAHISLTAWPATLAGGLLLATLPRLPETNDDTAQGFRVPGLMPFVLMVLVYAICEGSFGSWASLYLSVDKGLGNHAGTIALTAFWASMTLLRVMLARVPGRRVSQRSLLVGSSVGIAICFAALPSLASSIALMGAFALAGAACSMYYPLAMSAALVRFPQQQTQVAGLLVASLMVGEGIGSYGLGLLQRFMSLDHIYLVSALWGLPLMLGARALGRKPADVRAAMHRPAE